MGMMEEDMLKAAMKLKKVKMDTKGNRDKMAPREGVMTKDWKETV